MAQRIFDCDIRFGDASGPVSTWGAGDPEGVVTAPVGSEYRRTDGGVGTTLYVKESGTGDTGWVPKGSVKTTGLVDSNQVARFFGTDGFSIGASPVSIDDNGVITVPAGAIPAAPAADKLSLFARKYAGRSMLAMVGPSGLDTMLQPHLGGNAAVIVMPTSGSASPNAIGGNFTTAGSFTYQKSFGSTNRWLDTARKRYATTTTAGNSASVRQAYLQWYRGSAPGFGGFFFRAQFGININLNGSQCFVGLCPATGSLGGNPSTDFPLNMCGMGFDSTDPNTGSWQFFRNDGAGSPVKVDLGADAVRTVDVGYELVMFMAPGGSELFVLIFNLNTGAVVLDTSYTTDIPSVNTGMATKADVRNGTNAAAANLELAKLYCESDW